MYEDEEEQEEGPKSSFSTYLAEGDVLFKQGAYKKALDSYSQVSFLHHEMDSSNAYQKVVLGN